MHRQCSGIFTTLPDLVMVERRSRRTTADVMLTLKKSEISIVRKLFTHFKETPGTHKLGVLYLIDSIVRHWEHITRQDGRPPRSAAPDGSFAGGVDRLTKLLPILMTDIVNNAPPKHQVHRHYRNTQTGPRHSANHVHGPWWQTAFIYLERCIFLSHSVADMSVFGQYRRRSSNSSTSGSITIPSRLPCLSHFAPNLAPRHKVNFHPSGA